MRIEAFKFWKEKRKCKIIIYESGSVNALGKYNTIVSSHPTSF